MLSTAGVLALSREIDKILDGMIKILQGPEVEGDLQPGALQNLPREIEQIRSRIESGRKVVQQQIQTVTDLVETVKKEGENLVENLELALQTLPPLLDRARTALNELAATTIETSLIKLSLLRTETESKLYGHSGSSTSGRTSMAKAVAAAYVRMRTQERELIKEDKSLGDQLKEYQDLIQLVDGGRQGGFQQVVDDWVRVKRESEECRRDLRRLGWAGDIPS
ncbi:hypothetical protein CC2G_011802 [Coprinopsis cinerea AmutBmut pab1-1]|nr:hypothetical protein CC2G_011802 [Coprinopsis cinerea AmutBmut pab1-1]